jgi:hypothetical protein
MARVDAGDIRDPERIYIAHTLRLAKQAEEWLTAAGVDYTVEVEAIGRTLLFRSERMGAVFYVNAGQAEYCRQQLTAAGFAGGVVENAIEGPPE